MTYIENRNFDLNRILLITIGLWPYKQSNLVRLQLTLLFGIVLSFIAFHFSRLIFVDCTFDFAVRIISGMLLNILFAIKYNSFCVNKQTMKYLLDQLGYIYESLINDIEIAILEKYASNARRYTAKIILITMCSLFPLVCLTLSPHILDMIISKNRTYSRHIIEIVSKTYIVQEKYIYLLILYIDIAICIGAIALIATGTMLITYLKQVCGMFKIASFRIKRAMATNILQNDNLKNEIVMYKGIICAVDIHCKAMELATFFVSNFEGSFIFLIMIGVCCLSLNLFLVFQIASHIDEINEVLFIHLVFVIVILLYMFLGNYAGQEITDHNNHVFFTAYNVQWYLAPIQVQKLILFMLQRNSRIFSLNVGGLFAASLQCFSSMASTSISYFTVMYSIQE